jgi:hypothetical protein
MKAYSFMRVILFQIIIFFSCLSVNATVYNINENNSISVTTGYINNMEDVWNVSGTISNRPLAVYYSISTEANYDYVLIYNVDDSGNATLNTSLSGNKAGVVYIANPNGKVKIVFDTDGSVCYNPTTYSGIYLSFSYPENVLISNNAVFNSVRGSLTGGALRVKTDFGNLDIGAQNSSWAHIYTDRPKIIFDKPLYALTGEFSAYNTNNLSLQTNGITRMTILNSNGGVGIGTLDVPVGYKLAVAGKVIAEEVLIKLQSSGWSDFVFNPDYQLKSISEVESYINRNHHLPGIPDATTVGNEGVSMGVMQAKLLQKIEELTLYIIQQNNRIEELEKKIGR